MGILNVRVVDCVETGRFVAFLIPTDMDAVLGCCCGGDALKIRWGGWRIILAFSFCQNGLQVELEICYNTVMEVLLEVSIGSVYCSAWAL